MVFESILVEVLNKYLGNYVQNLDRSQLKVGIWGGNVVLKNLSLKPSTFDELDLPIRTVYGSLGKLTLQIPWKDIYNAPVIAEVEDLFALVVPNTDIKYDPVKEEKWRQSEKMAIVKKVEDAKKKEQDKDKPTPDSTFAEKLGTQIVKNVQIRCKNVHFRYEDQTSLDQPFAAGFTLESLSLKSIPNWGDPLEADPLMLIFKELSIKCLSLYWNPAVETLFYRDLSHCADQLRNGIATCDARPEAYNYVLGPINKSTNLRIHTKPEKSQFSIPRFLLVTEFKTLHLRLIQAQYRQMMELVDNAALLARAAYYRKYRPNVPCKGNSKVWWNFAYTCIVEEDLKRKQRNWDWHHIKCHREKCRSYAAEYEKKLLSHATTSKAELLNLEKELDAFSIIVIRQKVELQVEKQREKELEQKSGKSWFRGWWGGTSDAGAEESPSDIIDKIETVMTPEEKAKMYKAIGYQEGASPTEMPPSFVVIQSRLVLESIVVNISQNAENESEIIQVRLGTVALDLLSRKKSLSVVSTVRFFSIVGTQQNGIVPQIVSTRKKTSQDLSEVNLFAVSFDLRPLDDKFCDFRVKVKAEPLHITYDFVTFDTLTSFFAYGKPLVASQIQAAVQMKLAELKTVSTVGLQNMIADRKVIVVDVDLAASSISLPKNGFYQEGVAQLFISLGNLRVITVPNDRQSTSLSISSPETFQKLLKMSYDVYEITLTEVQLLYVMEGENPEVASPPQEMYFLKPSTLNIQVGKCVITDDPRFPKIVIKGKFGKIHMALAEMRLKDCLVLLLSIPVGNQENPEPLEMYNMFDSTASLASFPSGAMRRTPERHTGPPGELHQYKELELTFKIEEIGLSIIDEENGPFLVCLMSSLALTVTVETFEKHVLIELGKLNIIQNYADREIEVVETIRTVDEKNYLFCIEYSQVDKRSPDFHVKFGSVVQKIHIDFTKLGLCFHCEAILSLVKRVSELSQLVAKEKTKWPVPKTDSTVKPIKKGLKSGSHLKRRTGRDDVIDLSVEIVIGEIGFKLQTYARQIMNLGVTGGNASLVIRKSYTMLNAVLSGVEVIDLGSSNIFSKVVTLVDEASALQMRIVIFNTEYSRGTRTFDLSIGVSIAQLRFIVLKRFLSSVIEFLNNFQTATAKIVEASHAAAEAAKLNVQEAYSNATRIEINLKLQAPIVFLPITEFGNECFVLDLGCLTVDNTFVEVAVPSSTNEPAVLDRLRISLDNLKSSRACIVDSYAVTKEVNILKETSFKMTIQRNLSNGWFTEIPDLEISCKIPQITVHISRQTFLLALQLMNENVGGAESTKKHSVDSHRMVTNMVELGAKSFDSKEMLLSATSDTSVTEDVEVRANIKFSCGLEGLTLYLSAAAEDKDLSQDDFLGRLTLDVISIRGSVLSDGSVQASILLVDMAIQDMRETQKKKINRYMHRNIVDASTTGRTSKKSMVDVTIQHSQANTFISSRISSFTLILNVEYLMKIAAMFSQPPPPKPDIPAVVIEADTALKPKPSSILPNKPIDIEKKSVFNFNFNCEQPDIILIENMDDIDTNALILHAEVQFKSRLQESHQFISGSINNIQLFCSTYNPEKRNKTKFPVLTPFSMVMAGSTPENSGLHLDLCSTEIVLAVSPGVIRLLSNISAAAAIKEDSFSEPSLLEIDRTNLWDVEPFEDNDYYFLQTEKGEDALAYGSVSEVSVVGGNESVVVKSELCSLTVPSIVITLESGSGNNTMPLLLLEASVQANIRNWSSLLGVDCQIFTQISYFNNRLAVWEPILEPVEMIDEDGKEKFSPWELALIVETNKENSLYDNPNSNYAEVAEMKPIMSISVNSKENMPLTITKSCLEVLNSLSSVFTEAYFKPTEYTGEVAPYIIKNNTGLKITVVLGDGFKLWDEQHDSSDKVSVPSGAEIGISSISVRDRAMRETQSKYLTIEVEVFGFQMLVPVTKADKRFFLVKPKPPNDPMGIVSEVTVSKGCTRIDLSSVVKVKNNFNVPVSVYFMTRKGNELKLVGTVEPRGELNLTLEAVYTPTGELFFSVEGYSVSSVPFVWKVLQQSLEKTITMRCDPKNIEDSEPFFIQATGVLEQIFFENTSRHTMISSCYNIYIKPALIFKNLLPINIVCCVQGLAKERMIAAGAHIQIPTVEIGSSSLVIRIPDYLDKEWCCKHDINEKPEELEVWTFECYETKQNVVLDLGVHAINRFGTLILELFCPFWMLNKTGLLLCYKQADEAENILYHPPDFVGPIMFSFRAKSFFAKKKSQIRVENGPWSDKFSLDVAGSSGKIQCTNKNLKYELGIAITLTYSSLTKQIVFTPYFVIVNYWPITMECQEAGDTEEKWISAGPSDSVAFWPRGKTAYGMMMKVRVAGTTEATIKFDFHRGHYSLLKLDNKFGAVSVNVHVSDGGTFIALNPYLIGMAPALIINHTNKTIDYYDKTREDSVMYLDMNNKVMFTWATMENTGERELVFANGTVSISLDHDSIGIFHLNNVDYFWSCFLYGIQRVLLFTGSKSLARAAQNIGDRDTAKTEIEININGIGLSVVDNLNRIEILHMGVSSTGVAWQSRKKDKKRFKPLPERESVMIEAAYQDYLKAVAAGSSVSPQVTVEQRITVDFVLGRMLKPIQREIKRAYKTGLWIHFVTTEHTVQFHMKINKIQIDNQMFDCVFPVVLAPVNVAKTIAVDSVSKPFIELSCVKRINKHSVVQQFKYFKVLVQEFQVKLDIGFVNAITSMLTDSGEIYSFENENQGFMKDLMLKDEPLQFHVKTMSKLEQKHFFDYLHLSPLKIHLSFTMSNGSPNASFQFIGVLLQTFGVTLTDVQGVVLKLAYFERENCFMTKKQLMTEVESHYLNQLVKQLYVLVLGLDVIGNPFELVVGFGHGAKDLFYEPFQGAIQGPGEFVTGLAYGMRSLIGHTVGGAAGAVSKITGAMGKGLAVLTFDKEYQKNRRDMYNQTPANFQEGLAQSGKGLVMGVFHGVTGIVTKPISGAKEEGVQGFFKGAGKGLVGLVTRPTAGLVDFASGSFSAVKRATDVNGEATRMRPPRYIHGTGSIQPFSKRTAEGQKLLMIVDKGKYSTTDTYVYHMPIGQNNRDILILTDKRLGYIVCDEIFGGYQMDWSHTWSEISEPPKINENGVLVPLEKKKGVRGLFHTSEIGKLLLIDNKEKKQFIVDLVTKQLDKSQLRSSQDTTSETSSTSKE